MMTQSIYLSLFSGELDDGFWPLLPGKKKKKATTRNWHEKHRKVQKFIPTALSVVLRPLTNVTARPCTSGCSSWTKTTKKFAHESQAIMFASIICSLPISWSQLYKKCLEKIFSSSQPDKIAHKSSGIIIIIITITTRQKLAHTYIHTYVPHL